jgi:urease accessory protein
VSGADTLMRVDTQDPPWKAVRAFRENGLALVHLHNVSGGVLAGDRLKLRIDVGAGAKAQVTSTSATRLYRHRAGSRESRQHTSITVGKGGLLEYLPDSLIPFAGSRHSQRTDVRLDEGASLFWWEVLAPGRQAMGETFAFDWLSIETDLRSATRPLVLERYRLEPLRRPMESQARMGEYKHMASFYAIQVGCPMASIRKLEEELAGIAQAVSRPGSMIWGASALASDGVIVRGLSATGRELPATLTRLWSAARRFLTAEDAVPPRKQR